MSKIGLVLSGGMGKGAYQVGALKALSEFYAPSEFEYVSAASIGALNAYAFLTENVEKAEEIWRKIEAVGGKRFITYILKSSFLRDSIKEIVSTEKIKHNFYIPLLNIKGRELYYHNLSEVAMESVEDYLLASVSMPFYNRGVKIDTSILYDGAVIDNIPVYPLLNKDLDYIICVYFDDVSYIFESDCIDKKVIKLIFPDKTLVSNSIYFDQEIINHMIDVGYSMTKKHLNYILCDGKDDIEKIYKKIKEMNISNSNKKIRITGDVLVTNMNKITKKITRRRELVDCDER